ncbi:MAG: inorganic phosphate transporter [Bacteroidales bacterium]|jgi:phosphate/sulfate permease|nr:inorganic phosphate transporter [Bacteroidales bacterium]
MGNIYLFILIVLVALAVVDLIVGVSNDAVNFLNSAIGSKVTSRRVILAVASGGILAGAISSGGMMEIARSGVFHPNMFSFPDIMIIFFAVMITDVILLDMFNTFGLPTSTTVSLIFELLGSAVIVACYKIWTSAPGTVGIMGDYINSGKALTIISGILVSVVVAFVCGSVIMFLSRLLFSFRYKKTFRKLGAIWCGLALTAIAYFTLFKGMKGSPVISKDFATWLSDNIHIMLLALFAGFSIIMAILQHVFKINILKIIVLAGTCALALAFAGNDMVNFIGVTMAGISSYEIASAHAASGGNIETLMMGDLARPVTVSTLYLLVAGAVMVLALWFSKKAKTVTETEVNLARQGEGIERFGSTPASRALVRSARALNRQFTAVMPKSINRFIDRRFRPTADEKKNKAPFDLIRASVNLTVSALLISLATSLKLPLSTTYVTFMVAMGSSLSDRAWGRESAVYRITGVLTVISGWFMTALIAFTVASIVGLALMWGKTIAIVGMVIVCIFLLIQSSLLHKRRAKRQQMAEGLADASNSLVEKCNADMYDAFRQMSIIYTQTLKGLASEDRKRLKKLCSEARGLYRTEKERKTYEMLPTLDKLQDDAVETGHYYVQMLDYLSEVSKSLMYITRISFDYIDNNHTGLSQKQVADLETINREVSKVYDAIVEMLRTSDFSNFDRVLAKRDSIFDLIADTIKAQIKRVKGNESSMRNSILYLDIINETKAMVLQARNLMKAQRLFVGYAEEQKKSKGKKDKK